MSRNFLKFRTDKFDTCNKRKFRRLVPSRLHKLHESKFPFVTRIEFIRSKLSNFSAHVSGVAAVAAVVVRDQSELSEPPPDGRPGGAGASIRARGARSWPDWEDGGEGGRPDDRRVRSREPPRDSVYMGGKFRKFRTDEFDA